jgi:hypothetical protein
MRARFAYISSLGTTAILVAAALLMLAVVSAIVAFRGWPGQASTGGVQTVPLAPGGAAERVALVRRPATSRGLERRTARPSARAVRRFVSTARLGRAKAGGPRVVPGLVMEPVASAPMRPEGTGGGAGPTQTAPTAATAPQRAVPDQSQGPVPGSGGGITVPLPLPAGQAPSADQVTAMVDTLLAGAPPPPLLATLGR